MILGEVDDFDQPQPLLGPIEAEADAVLRQDDANGISNGVLGRVQDVELWKSLRFGLEAGEDIVERSAEDCRSG